MSTDLRTRRLIVTLPDVSGEEADTAASTIGHHVRAAWDRPDAAVTHALDDAPLDGCRINAHGQQVLANIGGSVTAHAPVDARKLAALLLRVADEAEGRA